MSNRVLRLSLSQLGTSGVGLTDALVSQKTEVGPQALLLQNSIAIGGVCTDYSGNVYVSDPENHMILKIQEGGEVVVFAGESGVAGDNGSLVNVPISQAKLRQPRGLACDRSGHIYVADTGNNQIRIIRDGFISLLAGQGDGSPGFDGGFGDEASFDTPHDVAVGVDGVVYVADTGNNSIRRIIPGGATTIYAGSSSGDSEDVDITTPDIFDAPRGLSVDQAGLVYVCDTGNHKIKTVAKNGRVYLHSGSGVAGKDLGTTAFDCKYNELEFCDIERSGLFYVVDTNSSLGTRVLVIDQTGIPSLINDFSGTSINDYVIGVAVNESKNVFCISYGDPDVYASSSSSSSEMYSESSSSSGGGGALVKVNCGASTDPQIKVTVCGFGAGTGFFLGETWTDGESKIFCPTSFSRSTASPINVENWAFNVPQERLQLRNTSRYYTSFGGFTYRENKLNVRHLPAPTANIPNFRMSQAITYYSISPSTTAYDYDLASFSPAAIAMSPILPLGIKDYHFGFVTTNSGVTIKWEPVAGVGSSAWIQSLGYVTTTANSPCP